jgi:hypothetical protein
MQYLIFIWDDLKMIGRFIKNYWKWLIFPVGLIGLLTAYLYRPKKIDTFDLPLLDLEPEPEAEKAVEQILAAIEERNKKIQELVEKNRERMDKLNSAQRIEFDELKKRPIEEVVKWFDNL